MNKESFIEEITKLNIKCTEEELEKLEKYCELLISWNKKMNLTSIKEKEQIYLKHFYDSLTIVKTVDLEKTNKLIDIGSGAGFPGIVLKIFFPHIEVDIIDSNNKKIMFINEVVKTLALDKVNLIHNRCEDYSRFNREKYDVVVSRAVANLNTLIEISFPLVKVNGLFISMKGICEKELTEIQNELSLLFGELESVLEFKLPFENSQRSLVKIKKVKSTPLNYPRSYDKIKKYPL